MDKLNRYLINVILILLACVGAIWLISGRVTSLRSRNLPGFFDGQALILTGDAKITQTFRSKYPGLYRVDLLFQSQSAGDGTVRIQIRELSCEADSHLVSIDLPNSSIREPNFYSVEFPPVEHSAGTDYCIVIEPAEADDESQIAVFASSTDIYPDGAGVFYQTEMPSKQNGPSSDFKPTHSIFLPIIFGNPGSRDFDIGFNLYYNGPALDTVRALLIDLTLHKTLIFGSPWFYPAILLVYGIALVVLLIIVWRRNENLHS